MFCMILHSDLSCFEPFSTILDPDSTDLPAAYGAATVAPLLEIHALINCSTTIY